jgi:hypothetical protein
MGNSSRVVDAPRIETSIWMLNQYLGEDDIASLVDVLESIAFNPSNEALLNQLPDVFAGRGRFYRAPC